MATKHTDESHIFKHDVTNDQDVAHIEKQLDISEGTSAPAGHVAQTPEDIAMSRKINLKMDVAMLPLLSILYLFHGLDRGNVGNAETQNFTEDIGASPADLNLAVTLFFITFVLFQPPSAAVGRWIGARHWIPILMFSWGIVTIGVAFIDGSGSLIATRLLIGLLEAGFYPTAVAYLSFFYRRCDLAVRVALFYGQYAIAGAFSGAIGEYLQDVKRPALNSIGSVWNLQRTKQGSAQLAIPHFRKKEEEPDSDLRAVIEGTLTCFFAIVGWIVSPTGPGSAWFLKKEEHAFASERIRQDNALYTWQIS